MSYDVFIAGESFGCTWNVAKLFYDHIPAERTERGGIHELEGLTGRQAGDLLARTFDKIDTTRHRLMRNNEVGERTFCAQYDPSNGWGSTVGALMFLSRLMAACYQNPRHKVELWT